MLFRTKSAPEWYYFKSKTLQWRPLLKCAYSNWSTTKFHLNPKILIFWIKFTQKVYFQSKTEKVNSSIEFCIFELVYEPNFSLNLQFSFFILNLPKKVFLVKNGKSEYDHWFLHIGITMRTKFQLNLTILIF